jgi:ElaB/YqjD/DUF883 family membrane-anchored ribosome-binding protein
MADQPKPDVATLQTEIKQLRTDFAKLAETMHGMVGNGVAGEGHQLHASTDKVWTEVKRHAGNVTREIEEKPIASAVTAFGAGILFGLLLNRRRA